MSTITPGRPDLRAHDTVTRMSEQQLVAQLRELLGVQLVAAIAGVKQTRTIHDWAEGRRAVRAGAVIPRLRLTLVVAQMIAEVETPPVLQAWLQGLNPDLDDRSPARLLKDGDLEDEGPQVLAAARSFVADG